MEKKKILFLWDVPENLKDYFELKLKEKRHVLELIYIKEFSMEKALNYAPNVDAIIGWRPTKELLEKSVKLTIFNNPGIGVKSDKKKKNNFSELSRKFLFYSPTCGCFTFKLHE